MPLFAGIAATVILVRERASSFDRRRVCLLVRPPHPLPLVQLHAVQRLD
jgi:hypothetical protein